MRDAMSESDIPRSISRLLDVFERVVESPDGATLTNAAEAVELTPTTTLRYLRALERRGYLERDDAGRFSPGVTLRRIAATVHEDSPVERLIAATQPHLDRLAALTGESCYLALADGRLATYVACAEGSHTIRHVGWVGRSVPLDTTAVGAALREPGVDVTRTGTVEPDITAVALGFVPPEVPAAAISVIGPQHRLDAEAQRIAADALATAVTALTNDRAQPTDRAAS